MRTSTTRFVASGIFLMSLATTAVAAPKSVPPNLDLSCTGAVHAAAVDLWENSLKNYYAEQIGTGLGENKDTYVLYNAQTSLDSFARMSGRCKDQKVLTGLVDVFMPALQDQESIPGSESKGWICRGGSICNDRNHLLGKEVQLNSAQFLGLLASISNAVIESTPTADRSGTEKAFITQTSTAIATHLDRWLSPAYLRSIQRRRTASPRNGAKGDIFTDKDLWNITLLADLSALHGHISDDVGKQAFAQLRAKDAQISQLIDLFLARISLHADDASHTKRAEIDRGYWTNNEDSKFAAYKGANAPVGSTARKGSAMASLMEVGQSATDPDVGWDVSHARRLVPAMAALGKNVDNLQRVFGYANSKLQPDAMTAALSQQITDKIWNKDSQFPLFTNFWDGGNGWYRVNYDNGTGSKSGIGPFGLTISFATGGYAEWGKYNPEISTLGARLYQIFNAKDQASVEFTRKYYEKFSPPGNASAKSAYDNAKIAFLSSLVGN